MNNFDENPLEYTKRPSVFDRLLSPVLAFVKAQDDGLSRHHNQTYGYYDFFRLSIYYFVSGIPSIKQLLDLHLKKGLLPDALGLRPVARSTFNDAFERFSPDLFRDVFKYLLSVLPLKQVPELIAFGTLFCIDGSLFPVIRSMQWASYTTSHQALKIHLCFELNRMIPIDFLVGSGNSSERDALRRMVVAGVTYIADRGYMSFPLCHEILQAKAHFIFRVKANLVTQIVEHLSVELPVSVRGLFHQVSDSLIRYTNDPHGRIHRLVYFQTGGEQFYILTDRRDITTFQVIMLYAYRWQIELLFRFLKRTMGGIHLIKQDERGVTIQFYAMLIAALLELHLKQDIIGKTDSKDDLDVVETNNEERKGVAPESSAQIVDGDEKQIPSAYEFIRLIGDDLKKFWKIGIHWLSALRSLLASPFDRRSIEILGEI